MQHQVTITLSLFQLIASISDENVAVGKTAYQTDTSISGNPSRAVDGILSADYTAGSCTHTLSYNVSWEVDLGSIYSIDNVTLYNRLDCCSSRLNNVQLYIGLSRDTYNLQGFHAGAVDVSYCFKFAVYVSGRWVKISRSGTQTEELTLCEVQVFGRVRSTNTGAFAVHASRKVAIGNVLSSTRATSELQCAYICQRAVACNAATYNSTMEECILYDTVSSVTTTSDNGVLLTLL